VPRDLELADRLRAAGLTVVEVAGWRERGSASYTPRGAVHHHTAGARRGNIPSLNVLIYGRADLPGPLCNVAQARDNSVYVIASGRANHAGAGGWRGLSGNSSVMGLEVENTGTEPWRPDQVETSARIHAALARGRYQASMVCQHREWAPRRKVDAHSIDGATFRARVAQLMGAAPAAAQRPSEEDEPMMLIRGRSSKTVWLTNLLTRTEVQNNDQLKLYQFLLTAAKGGKAGEVQVLDDVVVNAIPRNPTDADWMRYADGLVRATVERLPKAGKGSAPDLSSLPKVVADELAKRLAP
jgi:hypothetical protein